MADLPVKSGTTPQQIETYLRQDVKPNSRILARKTDDGGIVLYEKPKAKTFGEKFDALIDRITGRTARREERALGVIREIFKGYVSSSQSDLADALTTRVTRAIANRQGTGVTRAAFLDTVLLAARNLPPTTQAPGRESGYPSLQQLGMKADDPAIKEAARALTANPKDTGALNKLSDALLKRFEEQNNKLDPKAQAANREAFALSDGIKLTFEIKAALTVAMEQIAPKSAARLDNEGTLLTIFSNAAAKVMPDGVGTTHVTVNLKDGGSLSLPNMTFGGVEYTPVPDGHLGSGGNANVFKYQTVKAPVVEIAVKLMKGSIADMVMLGTYSGKMKEAQTEIKTHQLAAAKGSEHIVDIHGWLRMPDGNVAIGMELVPGGDVSSAGAMINELRTENPAEFDKKLSPTEANILHLTMLADMVDGLADLHAEAQDDTKNADDEGDEPLVHRDFKGQNAFIGANGRVKIGDFGLTMAASGNTRIIDAQGDADNPIYKAPELHVAARELSKINKRQDDDTSETIKPAVDRLRQMLPEVAADQQLLTGLAVNQFAPQVQVLDQKARNERDRLVFNEKVDIFGLGATALELLTRRPIAKDKSFMSDIIDVLANFGQNRSTAPLSAPDSKGNPQNGAIGLLTNDPVIDDLLTQMLRGNPDDRASAQELQGHAAFRLPGVGSQEAIDLRDAIKTKDPAKIATARAALANAIERDTERQQLDDIKALVSDVETEIDAINDTLAMQEIKDLVEDVDTEIDNILSQLETEESKSLGEVAETETSATGNQPEVDTFDTIASQIEDDIKSIDELLAETETMPDLPPTPDETAPTPNELKDPVSPNRNRPLPTPPSGPNGAKQ